MEVVIRGQLTTLDNQPAFLQMGQRVPRVTGTMSGTPGRNNRNKRVGPSSEIHRCLAFSRLRFTGGPVSGKSMRRLCGHRTQPTQGILDWQQDILSLLLRVRRDTRVYL